MGKSLAELDLKDEQLPPQPLEDLPVFGGFAPPPQPGPYRFRLPSDLSEKASIWDVFDYQGGQRIRMIFDQDHPLTIISASNPKYLNERFDTRISNAERARGKTKIVLSDMDYLLAALGVKVRPSGNRALIAELSKHAGREFGADITWNWSCNQERSIRIDGGDGKLVEVQGQNGCGKRYYQRDVQKDLAGEYAQEITCTCGGVLRAFANLENLRA